MATTRNLAARIVELNTRLQISMLEWPPPILTLCRQSSIRSLDTIRMERLSLLLDRLDVCDDCRCTCEDDGWLSSTGTGAQPIHVVTFESTTPQDYVRVSNRSRLVSVVNPGSCRESSCTQQRGGSKRRRISSASREQPLQPDGPVDSIQPSSSSSGSHQRSLASGTSRRKAGWMIFFEPPRSAVELVEILERHAPITGAYLMLSLQDREAMASWMVPLLEQMSRLLSGAQRLEIEGWVQELYQDVFVVVSELVKGEEQIQASLRLPSDVRVSELRSRLLEAGVGGAECCWIGTKSGQEMQNRMSLSRYLASTKLARVQNAVKRKGGGNVLELHIRRVAEKTIKSGDVVFLRGLYSRCIDVEDDEVLARWPDRDLWQELVVMNSSGRRIRGRDKVWLKTHQGRYVYADADRNMLCASFGKRTPKHQFRINLVRKDDIKDGMQQKLICKGAVNSMDEVQLVSYNGKYVQNNCSGFVYLSDRPLANFTIIKHSWDGVAPEIWQITMGDEDRWEVEESYYYHNRWPLHVLPPADSDKPPDLTVIYFSALNSAHAFEHCATWLDLGEGCQVRLVCPLHPRRQLTSGWGWYFSADGKAHAWFDYLEQLCVWADLVDAKSLCAARRKLHELIDRETEKLKGRSHRIILAGHSHGACFALDGLLSCGKELGGALCAVAHVLTAPHVPPQHDPLEGAAPGNGFLPNGKTPIFMLNGQKDDVYPPIMVRQDVRRLKAAGYKAVNAYKVEGAGHEIGTGIYKKWWLAALKKIARRCKVRDKKIAAGAGAVSAPRTAMRSRSPARQSASSRFRSPVKENTPGTPGTEAPMSPLDVAHIAPSTPLSARARSPAALPAAVASAVEMSPAPAALADIFQGTPVEGSRNPSSTSSMDERKMLQSFCKDENKMLQDFRGVSGSVESGFGLVH